MTPILVPTLAQLSIELSIAKARYDDINRRWNAGEEGLNDLLDETSDECVDIAEAIAELPATSLADLRIKARALTFGGSYLDEKGQVTEDRLIAQIMSGLLDERIVQVKEPRDIGAENKELVRILFISFLKTFPLAVILVAIIRFVGGYWQ